MDFGDFITFIFFLFFIISPFFQRRKHKKRKKTGKSGKSKQRGFSVLGKLNEILKEAAREMEAQAQQAREKEAPGQGRHRDAGHPEAPSLASVEPVKEKTHFVSAKKAPGIPETMDAPSLNLHAFEHDDIQTTRPRSVSKQQVSKQQKVRALQKAVIWSEILGKPVGLRD